MGALTMLDISQVTAIGRRRRGQEQCSSVPELARYRVGVRRKGNLRH